MLSVYKLLSSIFIVSFKICCGNNLSENPISIDESPLKLNLVEDIVKKVCNISLNVFAAQDPVEKAIILKRIEDKLIESAQALGVHGTKYVDLIMRGVKAKAFENNEPVNYRPATNNEQVQNSGNNEKDTLRRANDAKRGAMVNDIEKKIEFIARGYLSNAKTEEEREKMIANIKKRVAKNANRKSKKTGNSKDDEIQNYVDLVSRGIEIIRKKDAINRRKMEFVYTNNINLTKDPQNHNEYFYNSTLATSLPFNEDQEASNLEIKPKSVFLKINGKTTVKPIQSCNDIQEDLCQEIEQLKTITCLSDNKQFNLLKLCDGVGDCLDFSDENHCSQQAIQTVQSAHKLLEYIENSISTNRCFYDLLDQSVIAKRIEVLSGVLRSEISSLEKRYILEPESFSRRVYNRAKNANKESVRNAMNIVDSLTSSLGISICPNFNRVETKLNNEELKEILRQSQQNLNDCKCNGPNCLQKCTPRCKSVCSEIYGLSQFTCESVTREDVVPLDTLCDGKLDCLDETDEKDCSAATSLGKFEATQMYEFILEEIKLKTASVTSEVVRSNLQTLHALVTKLQKITLSQKPDTAEVKRVRQASFKELMKVYENALIHLNGKQEELFSIRFNLVTLNERLISALKRSNTGNDKITALDGCVCRENKCALLRCTKSCIRACSAENQLTKFFCNRPSDSSNDSLPIEVVCNGKENCPNGEDEKDCSKDVCRSLHWMLLRNKLQDVGKKYSGTSLGEALSAWKTKAMATLAIAESFERPKHIVMYDVLHEMLHDLLMAYGTLDRRDHTPVFKEFYSWSRVIINTLKTCGK